MNYVEYRAVAFVTLSVGVLEVFVDGKQDGLGCNRDVEVPEEKFLENKM